MSGRQGLAIMDVSSRKCREHLRNSEGVLSVRNRRHGFTLVEIMIVVAIIGLLAAIAVPAFLRSRRQAQVTKVANDLRVFSEGFGLYCLENGLYPPDTHIVLPPGMTDYIRQDDWDNGPPWGGTYNWEGPSWGEGGGYPYAGIALFETQADAETLTALDELIDNGDLTSGKFRLTANSRYTYIFEE